MKRKQLSAVALGLAWMASLGAVFILGILSAFAFHLAPGGGADSQGDLTLDQRDMVLIIERFTGEEVDVAELLSVAGDEPVPPQLEQSLRAIMRESDPDFRQMATARLLGGLPARRVMAVIRFLQEIRQSPARNQILREFLESWGNSDGRSAIAFATSLSAPRERQLATGAVLRGWSQARPSDAWNWVIEREGKTRRAERWLELILSNLGRTDRGAALALLEKSPSGDFQTQMSLVVLEQILRTESPREALRWLGELPEGSAGAAAGFLAQSWSVTEPAAAAEWLYKSFPSELEGLENVVREWTYSYPEAAADWVWDEFSGNLRRALMDVLADEWVANDGPVPLAEWLNTHGPDPALDGAIESIVLMTANLDPATALVWAQSIVDPDARSMLEIMVGRQWIRMDPDSAADSLPVLLESESARAALLEPEVSYEPAYEEVDDTRVDESAVPFEDEEGLPPLQ
ncbi:hypothetical protein G0Q06_04440 [Puniceicoccales bacterium CK1056]|uniref:Uncharacterized protein n=1 Tax=Oceanipulchritudo coccoides TaxID=2706888 RepID=A0A6B2LYF6_9BACT|nr:hypothetical protein [Oceanipulchritudo coccoides]NDV61691.1 hypothetical protein [Oceanipulchritudo coccoides]